MAYGCRRRLSGSEGVLPSLMDSGKRWIKRGSIPAGSATRARTQKIADMLY